MPNLAISGELLAVYRTPSYTNRQTGEVTPEAHRLQILESEDLNGQTRYTLHNIKTEHPQEYREMVGSTITLSNLRETTIPVRQRFFYIPKGAKPPSLS